jgi:DNA polymerase-1
VKTLYLIDGYAQFFRAYHAIRTPMTSPVTREPTNMSFGFIGMLLKLLRGEAGGARAIGKGPDYVALALDVSGDRETFRSELYADYKATRPPAPEDLRPQVDRCLAVLRDIGVPILGVPGFEADDVIAALAEQLRRDHPDLRIRVISKDKDLKQLLRAGLFELYDIHTDQLITEDTLREENNLRPDQVVDMLALMGDTVDNIPGVEGVGPKTAAQLIAQYGSLDELLAHADEVKGKRGEKLRAAGDILTLSRQLVTLRADVPLDFDLAAADASRLQVENLRPALRELGFNRYQEDLDKLLGREEGAPAPQQTPVARARPALGSGGGWGAEAGLFDALEPASAAAAPEGDYCIVRTEQELRDLAESLRRAGRFAFDTETTSERPMKAELCGMSFAIEPGAAWYVPVMCPEPGWRLDARAALDVLRLLLEDPQIAKLGHNLKYDLLVLRRVGVEFRGIEFDSMIASYLIDSSRSSHSLDALALALLGRTNVTLKELLGTGRLQKTFDKVPLDRAGPYAAEDADVALQLAGKMLPQIRAMGLMDLMRDVELPLLDVLAELEYNGILVDPEELDNQRTRLAGRIDALRARIQDEAMETVGRGFDPDSPRQLASILFNKPDAAEPGLGIRPLKRRKTGPSTDAEVLEKLVQDAAIESPIPDLILEYRQLTKLVSTYLLSLKEEIHPETKRIHASFNQTVAATGRLSSSDPNLQNIPIRTDIGREIRRAFMAPPGRVLISADYSQIELRILAHLSRDPALIEAFRAGADIHAAVAAQIHGVPEDQVTRKQRDGAKMVNFGIVYGITPYGLARRLGIGASEAGGIIDGYKRRFAGITTFLEECIDQARRHGYVETMLRRRRPIGDIDSRNPSRRALAERMAINTVVQGSAADLIKLAMLDLNRRLSPRAQHLRDGPTGVAPPEIEGVLMLLQIHDELVFEAPETSAEQVRQLIVSRMEHAMDLSVPLKVDSAIGASWFEGK